jgi:hypothetical protein
MTTIVGILAMLAIVVFAVSTWWLAGAKNETELRGYLSAELGMPMWQPLFRGCKVHELNAGQGGWTTLQGLQLIDPRVMFTAQVDPDLQLTDQPVTTQSVLIVCGQHRRLYAVVFSRRGKPNGTVVAEGSCKVNILNYLRRYKTY